MVSQRDRAPEHPQTRIGDTLCYVSLVEYSHLKSWGYRCLSLRQRPRGWVQTVSNPVTFGDGAGVSA